MRLPRGIIGALALRALSLITVAIVLLSVEVGYRLGNRTRQRAEKKAASQPTTLAGLARQDGDTLTLAAKIEPHRRLDLQAE